MKGIIVSFDDFSRACPWFTTETGVNNCYGCQHPEQVETQPGKDGLEHGCCFNSVCPVGYLVDEEAFNDPDIDRNDFEKGDFIIDGEVIIDDGDHLIINIADDASEDEKRAYTAYLKFINRYC